MVTASSEIVDVAGDHVTAVSTLVVRAEGTDAEGNDA